MRKTAEVEKLSGLASRFGAFVAERHPFALADALDAFESATHGRAARDDKKIEALRPLLRRELTKRLKAAHAAGRPGGVVSPDAGCRRDCSRRRPQLIDDCDGFLRRAAIQASLTPDERIEILRGMILTRATDNRLKSLLHRRRGPLRRHGVSGQGFPLARPGSDLRGSDPPAPRRRVSRPPTADGPAT